MQSETRRFPAAKAKRETRSVTEPSFSNKKADTFIRKDKLFPSTRLEEKFIVEDLT